MYLAESNGKLGKEIEKLQALRAGSAEEMKEEETAFEGGPVFVGSAKVCKEEEFLKDNGGFANIYANDKVVEGKVMAQKSITRILNEMAGPSLLRLFRDLFNEMNIMLKLKKGSCKQIISLSGVSFQIVQTSSEQQNSLLGFHFFFDYMQMNLDKFIAQKKNLNWKKNLYILNEVAQGIRHMHDLDVIHGDIKPSNILLDEQLKEIKIVDYGTSRILEQQQLNIYQSQVITTPKFTPKELYQNRQNSKKVDIYGFGCLMFNLFTGQVPYCDLQGQDIWKQNVIDYYKDHPQLYNNYALDTDIQDLIRDCTEIEVDKRVIDINQVIDRLQQLKQGDA